MKNRELAKKIGTSEAFVSLMLSGKRRPSWDTAMILSSIFGNKASFWMTADSEEMRTVINEQDAETK